MDSVGSKSHVSKANTTSGSLRTTIPEDVVEKLGLTVKDVLDWDIITEKGRTFARFRRME